MTIVVVLDETEYNQLASEQLGVNVVVGNYNYKITVDPKHNY